MPIWTGQQSGMSGKNLSQEKIKEANQIWLDNLKEESEMQLLYWIDEDSELCSLGDEDKPNPADYNLNNEEELEEYNEELSLYKISVSRWRNNGGDSFECKLETLKSKYQNLIEAGVHKQNANRLLAPFAWTTCILTGTEWENFFELRCPRYEFFNEMNNSTMHFKSKKELVKYFNDTELNIDSQTANSEEFWQSINKSGAQPEFQAIAEMLYDLYQEVEFIEWDCHIPFEDDIENLYGDEIRKKIGVFRYAGSGEEARKAYREIEMNYFMLISASMCAKLSYDTQDKVDTFEKHLERAQVLLDHKHQEPFSHQAIAMDEHQYPMFAKRFMTSKPDWSKQRDLGTSTTGVHVVEEFGWCYTNKGFITKRYMIENNV